MTIQSHFLWFYFYSYDMYKTFFYPGDCALMGIRDRSNVRQFITDEYEFQWLQENILVDDIDDHYARSFICKYSTPP